MSGDDGKDMILREFRYSFHRSGRDSIKIAPTSKVYR